MSRKITVQCQIEEEELLFKSLEELGLEPVDLGGGQYRFRFDDQGFALPYSGLVLTQEGGAYKASYDEESPRAIRLLGKILQFYMRNKYLREAMRQGDQVQREFVATGLEGDPLLEPGDLVIMARKA